MVEDRRRVEGRAYSGRSSHGRNAPSARSACALRAADSAAALTSRGVCQRTAPSGSTAQPSVSRRVRPAPSGAHASRCSRSTSGAAQRLVSTCTRTPGTRRAIAAWAVAGANGAYTNASVNGPRAATAASNAASSAGTSAASTAAALICATASSRARRATTVTGVPPRPSVVAAGSKIPVPPTTRT